MNELGAAAEDRQAALASAHAKISALSQQLMGARDQLSSTQDSKARLEARLALSSNSTTVRQAALEHKQAAVERKQI